jgi:hypothetical protein
MRYWVIVALSLVACISQTPLPFSTVTQFTYFHSSYAVTYIIKIEPTVVVTATPVPLRPNCFKCDIRAIEWVCGIGTIAKEKLKITISQIDFSPEEKQAFDKLQAEWEAQVEKDCEFFYSHVVRDDNGNLYYKNGSMALMQRSLCIAEQYKRRIEDLRFAFVTHRE